MNVASQAAVRRILYVSTLQEVTFALAMMASPVRTARVCVCSVTATMI